MPLDISKSSTKTEINLSKPYHQGPLLIDFKARSSKTLIDIKPIKKPTQSKYQEHIIKNKPEQDISKKIDDKESNNQSKFTNDYKLSTLDFDKLNEFDDLLNPFLKVDYRDANNIRIPSLDKNITKKVNVESKIKQVGDIKKSDLQNSNLSFSSLKPKINVAPLHSRSRTLAVIDQNRELAKKFRDKRKQAQNENPNFGFKTDLEAFETGNFNNKFKAIDNQDFFQFKAPLKFDASDIPQFFDETNSKLIDHNSSRVNLPELNKEIHNSNLRKKIRNRNKFKRYSASTLFTTIIIIFCTLFLTGNAQWMGKFGEKNVSADKSKSQKVGQYDKWIAANNFGNYSSPGEDLDKDGLNNYEEFLINSNPTNKNSCNINVTDNANLLNLIDPVTCLPIDFDAPGQVARFKEVLNITPEFIQKHQKSNLQNQSFITPSVQVKDTIISVSQSSAAIVTDILPVSNIEFDDQKSPTFIETSTKIQVPKLTVENAAVEKPLEIKVPEIKKPSADSNVEILAQKSNVNISAVQQYIDQYRSYDKYDNQIQNPINAKYFIEMSNKYNVPLKYSLAIARSESRFGTDQFNQDGSANRIGRHLNMYSIGLDDAGGSITYPSWEAGVDAFGKWYTKFENQGYSDCAKWRIYNPNGDYCQKIENLATQIENYIAN